MLFRIARHPILGKLNREVRAGLCGSAMYHACDDAALQVFGVTRSQLLASASPAQDLRVWDERVTGYKSETQATDACRIRLFITLGFDPRDEAGIMPTMGYFGVLFEALLRKESPPVACECLERFRRLKLTLADNDNATNDDDEPIQALLDSYGVDF